MELFSAIADIQKQYPTLDESEIRAAMDSEAAWEETQLTGRSKYSRAVEAAHDRILVWLKSSREYNVDPADLESLCRFVSGRRQASVWAILRGRQFHASE